MLRGIGTEQSYWQAQLRRIHWQSPQAAGMDFWWPMRLNVAQAYLLDPIRNAYGALVNNLNPMTWGTDPQYGPALRFPTYAWIEGLSLNFSAPLTIAVWCRPDFQNATGVREWAKVFCKGHVSTLDPYFLVELGTDNASPAHWNAGLSTGIAGSAVGVNSVSTLTSQALTHVAMTYNGTVLLLYVNGLLEGSLATTLTIGTNNAVYTLGAQYGNPSNGFWSGVMLDVRSYTRALSDADIWQLYDPATRWDLYAPILYPPFKSGAAITPPLFSLQPRMLVVT